MEEKTIKVYGLEEICEYLRKEKPNREEKAKFTREGFRCFGSGERGMGGFSRTAKFIPESIHIMVTPQSCLRHCDFDLKLNGYTTGVYSLLLTEKEIVGGKVVETVEKCILELLEKLEPRPKVITIIVGCIDGLIRSDYTALKRMLKEQFGIRFGVVEMFPILAENKIKHTDKFTHAVFSLLEVDLEKPKKNVINILGKVDPADDSTDFYTVLGNAGYKVREIRQCQTLEDFDEMGEACMNIVLSEFALYAARMMEKEYHIPYMFWNEHMNPETIKANYEELERRLQCRLDIEEYYAAAKEKAQEVRELAAGKTFAIGQRLDYIPVKAACDLAELGLEIKFVFTDKIVKEDLAYYERLMELSPQTKIYLAPDISMKKFMKDPENADVLVCGSMILMKNAKGILPVNLSEEPYDFTTFMQVAEQLKQQLMPKTAVNKAVSGKNETKEYADKTMFRRVWKSFPKGV